MVKGFSLLAIVMVKSLDSAKFIEVYLFFSLFTIYSSTAGSYYHLLIIIVQLYPVMSP